MGLVLFSFLKLDSSKRCFGDLEMLRTLLKSALQNYCFYSVIGFIPLTVFESCRIFIFILLRIYFSLPLTNPCIPYTTPPPGGGVGWGWMV